jgi:hypothetical protein
MYSFHSGGEYRCDGPHDHIIVGKDGCASLKALKLI